jgi:hypothetical protein
MEIAYQTPKLSQFHIGFRYEFKQQLTIYIEGKEPIVNNDWIKGTTSMYFPNPELPMIATMIENGLIRVKSLDHDDIIEAGWEENETQSSEFLADYILGDYLLDIFDSERGIRINLRHETVFFGKIANYNKLLDVMEMLGINKEK